MDRKPGVSSYCCCCICCNSTSGRHGSGGCWARSTRTLPVFGDGQLAVQSGRLLAGLHVDGDVEFALGFAAEDAVGGRNIGIVAADGGADVAVMGDEVVGGIKTDPAEMRQQDSTHACVASGVERSWSSRLR